MSAKHWWTTQEIADLRNLVAQGRQNDNIAEFFGMTVGQIRKARNRYCMPKVHSKDIAHECA